MNALVTDAQRQHLEFSNFGEISTRARVSWALALFAVSVVLFATMGILAPMGAILTIVAHSLIWLPTLTLSDDSEVTDADVWTPVDVGWIDRARDKAEGIQTWDQSALDSSSSFGCFTLVVVLFFVGALGLVTAEWNPGGGVSGWGGWAAAGVLLPFWFNGRRHDLRVAGVLFKGLWLEIAIEKAARASDAFEPVVAAQLRRGDHGSWPVDLRVMLQPVEETDRLIGVQIQVSVNSVQGTQYPYVYCVVLAPAEVELPTPDIDRCVCEPGAEDDVRFMVIRHETTSEGWKMDGGSVDYVVGAALKYAEARR